MKHRHQKGSASVQAVSMIAAVALAGAAGLSQLGGGMDHALRGDARSGASIRSTVVTSSQAGVYTAAEYAADRLARYAEFPSLATVDEVERLVRSTNLLEPRAKYRGLVLAGPDSAEDQRYIVEALERRLGSELHEGVHQPAAFPSGFSALVSAEPDKLAVVQLFGDLGRAAPLPSVKPGGGAELAAFLDNHHKVFVLARTESLDSVDPLLLEPGRFLVAKDRDGGSLVPYAERLIRDYLGTAVMDEFGGVLEDVSHGLTSAARKTFAAAVQSLLGNEEQRALHLNLSGGQATLTPVGSQRVLTSLEDGDLARMITDHVLTPLVDSLSVEELLSLFPGSTANASMDELLRRWSQHVNLAGPVVTDAKGLRLMIPHGVLPREGAIERPPAFVDGLLHGDGSFKLAAEDGAMVSVNDFHRATAADVETFVRRHLPTDDALSFVRRAIPYTLYGSAEASTLDVRALAALGDKYADEIRAYWNPTKKSARTAKTAK